MSDFHAKRAAMGIGNTLFARLSGCGVSTVRQWEKATGPTRAPAWAYLLLDAWETPEVLERAKELRRPQET